MSSYAEEYRGAEEDAREEVQRKDVQGITASDEAARRSADEDCQASSDERIPTVPQSGRHDAVAEQAAGYQHPSRRGGRRR